MAARRRLLAWLGLAGLTQFVALVLALHVQALRQEPEHMSEFANTGAAGIWVLAMSGFIIGGGALSLAVRLDLARSPFQRIGVALLGLAVLGATLLAAFPMDKSSSPTLAGAIHGDAALGTFLLLGAAMIVLAPAFRSTPGWKSFGGPSLRLGILASATCSIYLVGTLAGFALAGLAQRVMVSFAIVWFIRLGIRLLEAPAVPRAAATRPSHTPRTRRPSRAGAAPNTALPVR